jgi:hypothetical protein
MGNDGKLEEWNEGLSGSTERQTYSRMFYFALDEIFLYLSLFEIK